MKKGSLKHLLVTTPLIVGALGAFTACSSRFTPGPADTYDIDFSVDTKGTTITMWTGFGSDMTKVLEEVLDEFTKQTGIIVKHESKGGYPNLLKAINLSSTSGTYPNLANGYPDHFASYVKSNILLRLDGLLQNDKNRGTLEGAYTQDGTRFGPDGIMLMDYDDFYDDYTLENETLEFDEKGNGYVLGIPFNKSTEVMVYNADLFDWADANPSLVEARIGAGKKIYVPTTWAEVKEVGTNIIALCKGLFKVGDTKGKILATDGNTYDTSADVSTAKAKIVLDLTEVLENDFRPFTYDSSANLFITLVRQYGGQYTEVDKSSSGKGYAVFKSQETYNAMNMLQDLFDSKIFAIPDFYDELFCSNAFKAYKCVMNVGSTAGLSNYATPSITKKCAPIPSLNKEDRYVISQGTSLGLFNKGTDAEKVAAWKLMVYLSQQANGYFAAQTGYFPTCDYSYNSLEYQSYLDDDFKNETAILRQDAASINANNYVKEWTKFVDPGFRGSADIREQVELIPGYLMVHQYKDVEATIDAVYKSISNYVKN